ncbi:MAG: cysteine hydrolase [Clostridia bacterium]|nr:cysteine hydrolase [Clostridia bacterium]
MKHVLIVVDMQTDFVDGALGTPEAVAILESVAAKIKAYARDPDGAILVTYDTHAEDYMETSEGKHLPVPHCIKGTAGWELHPAVAAALEGVAYTPVEKPTFGSVALPALVKETAAGEDFTLELIGLCTDICVVSNTLLLKASYPEIPISVDAACCAGVTPETHKAALVTMGMCQIEVKN